MKTIRFLGNSLQQLRDFPENARHDAGYQLERSSAGSNRMILSQCRRLAGASKNCEYLMSQARFEWYIPHASLTWSMCCMLSNRKRKLRRGGIWR